MDKVKYASDKNRNMHVHSLQTVICCCRANGNDTLLHIRGSSWYTRSQEIIPALRNLIPEAIPSQKYHMNVGPILNGYRDMNTGNVTWASMRGHVHRQASAPVALRLAQCCQAVQPDVSLHH